MGLWLHEFLPDASPALTSCPLFMGFRLLLAPAGAAADVRCSWLIRHLISKFQYQSLALSTQPAIFGFRRSFDRQPAAVLRRVDFASSIASLTWHPPPKSACRSLSFNWRPCLRYQAERSQMAARSAPLGFSTQAATPFDASLA